jgi:hypothetical protein
VSSLPIRDFKNSTEKRNEFLKIRSAYLMSNSLGNKKPKIEKLLLITKINIHNPSVLGSTDRRRESFP